MDGFGLQMVSVLMPIATDHALLNVGGAMLFGATFVGIVSPHAHPDRALLSGQPGQAMARMTSMAWLDHCARHGGRYIATASGSYHGLWWSRRWSWAAVWWRCRRSPMKKSVQPRRLAPVEGECRLRLRWRHNRTLYLDGEPRLF